MKRRHVFAIMAVLLALPCMGQELARVNSPGFVASVDQSGWIRISYQGIPVVTGSNFSIAKPGWKGTVFPAKAKYRSRDERRGETRVVTLTAGVPGVARNTITIEVTPQQVRITNAYEIEASPDVGYVYTDCFLSKRLLDGARYEDDAGNSGVLRVADGKGIPNNDVRTAVLATRFGTLHLELTHAHTVAGQKGRVNWQFRSVCDRGWGPEERRTFSIPNVYQPGKPVRISGHSGYLIRFEPNAAFAQEIAKRRQELEADRQKLAAAQQARQEARKARIAGNGGIVLMPAAQRMEVLKGAFAVTPRTRIVVGEQQQGRDRQPAARLAQELRDYYRVSIPIVPLSRAGRRAGRIVIGRPAVNALSRSLLARWKLRLTGKDPGSEGYVLEVRPDTVLVAGSDVRGTWYGVQSLLQLVRWEHEKLVVPCVHIRDWPEFEVRGMMLTLGAREQMDFLRHTLTRVLPRMKLNMVFIGGASIGRVRWPSHPEIGSATSFTPEDIRELADLARANFMEPVPHVQGFGHTGPLKRVHPELLAPTKEKSPCFDIAKPEARTFVFDIYSDAIDAFKPEQYFHVGFDEAKGLDVISKGGNPADLIAEHITAVSDWLEQRNLRMIMWADMLLDKKRFGASSAANSNNPHYGNVNTAPALERIPKSVILANWYYRGAEEHPQLAYLIKAGFHVFPTTWFLPENNYNFLRSAHRIGLKWAAGSSWMYCSARNPAMMNLLVGEYAWTPDRPLLGELNYEPLGLLAQWMKPPLPSDVPCRQIPIDLRGVMNRSYVDETPGDDRDWLDLGPEQDLSALKSGRRQLGRYIFDVQPAAEQSGCVLVRGPRASLTGVPTSVTIEVGSACESLAFLHTAHCTHYGPRVLGAYTVTYADGEQVKVPLRNAINIGPWLKVGQLSWWRGERVRGYYLETERVWVGYTLAGDEVDLVAYEWVNPRPEVSVASVELALTDRSAGLAVGLFGLTALVRR